jgi:hypothetical protein
VEWFIIVLALGVAIGPILYLMPTERDRYLTSLRAQARKLGYTVQLDKVLKVNPDPDERVTAGGSIRQIAVSCTRYQLPLGVTVNAVSPILLLRISSTPTIPVERLSPFWAVNGLDVSQRKAIKRWQSDSSSLGELVAVLDQMPRDVLAVQLDKRFIAAFWREQSLLQQVDGQSAGNKPLGSLAQLPWFWPSKAKEPTTLDDLPRLQALDRVMRSLLNTVKKHWGMAGQ